MLTRKCGAVVSALVVFSAAMAVVLSLGQKSKNGRSQWSRKQSVLKEIGHDLIEGIGEEAEGLQNRLNVFHATKTA